LMQMQQAQGSLFIPQLRWLDGVEVNVEVVDLNITNSNKFNYKQVFTMKLVQPHFRFQSCPADTQTLRIRMTLFSFPNTIATVTVDQEGVYFLTDADGKSTSLNY
jgi:hypothetical protein